jgi:hypothetical protein
VPGLKYVARYVSDSDETALLTAVDAETWRDDLKRRVQHYGYRYDYTARTVDPSSRAAPDMGAGTGYPVNLLVGRMETGF